MKLFTLTVSALALAGLTACSAPAPKQEVAVSRAATPVAKYQNHEINEAASAYVALFKETIERSLAERKYQEGLAYRYLSAEACFESRANRLADKQITQKEKTDLILTFVPHDKLKAYESLSRGYYTRVNGLEVFTCELAGLKVDTKNLRY
jgi:hypothetical protein